MLQALGHDDGKAVCIPDVLPRAAFADCVHMSHRNPVSAVPIDYLLAELIVRRFLDDSVFIPTYGTPCGEQMIMGS